MYTKEPDSLDTNECMGLTMMQMKDREIRDVEEADWALQVRPTSTVVTN